MKLNYRQGDVLMLDDVKIGLEIHIQLTNLKSKLFCSCLSDYRESFPNSNICPICFGLPGSLPLLNRRAVEYAVILSYALECNIPSQIQFYRKNYFYPDLPKNFQITQYNAFGISSIGYDGIWKYDSGKSVRIKRIQLEEDPGRLVHDTSSLGASFYSLIDYNRAGVALLEIVTEPDFVEPKDVRVFLTRLASLVEHLGICNTKLDGSMRCDVNVSMNDGKKVEVKNINSMKEVGKALLYEITRQKTLYQRNIEVKTETRHWDAARKITKQSRSKEEEQDYRYFPEPDIPKIILSNNFLESIKANLPELPDEKRNRYINNYGLTPHVCQIIIDDKEICDFFETCVSMYSNPKEFANWIVTDIMGFCSSLNVDSISKLKITPRHLVELISLIDNKSINRNTAKETLTIVSQTGKMPSELIKDKNISQISDKDVLLQTIINVFDAEKSAVEDAKKNPNAANYLLGRVMRLTKGRADPKIVLAIINEKLNA